MCSINPICVIIFTSARESVADQMEKLRGDIAAAGENLIRFPTWQSSHR